MSNECAKRQVLCLETAIAKMGQICKAEDRDAYDFAAYCAIHGFPCPPKFPPDAWRAVVREVEATGPICTNPVDVPKHAKTTKEML